MGDIYSVLNNLLIQFEEYTHPPLHTVEDGHIYWHGVPGTPCKNIFFRNHKGDRHYLVILESESKLAIKDLEHLLKQGKLSFASEQRLDKYLGVKPGSVTPFGLINDIQHHVYVFIDERLKNEDRLVFHPLINTKSIVISTNDFMKFMNWVGNNYEFLKLY